MVFVNPGGPGASAIDDVSLRGSSYQAIVGTNYDIVAYEPRGIGYSVPLATCATSTPPEQLRKRTLYQPYGPRLPSKFYQDEYTFTHDLGAACAAAIGGPTGIGRHMSTAIVVRDAISILNAYAASSYSAGVTNPSYFNFWGFSYATVIGQTFAMMFPNRVGRFVLDGANDAEDYYSATGEKNIYLADNAFSTFFTYCSKAGNNPTTGCAFSTGSTPQAIFQRFEKIVLRLDAKRLSKRIGPTKRPFTQV